MASIRCSCPNSLGYPRITSSLTKVRVWRCKSIFLQPSYILHFLASTLHDSLTTALYTAVCARLCASHASTFPSLSRHFAFTPAPVLRARQLCGSARQPSTSTSQLYTCASQLYSSQNAQRFGSNGERFSENGHRFLLPTADTALATAHP